ncbi:MAG: exodeoxyribonuclease VII large subunit, partial [Bacteroidota bacterium]|nr:exodeoxyribonuclease VII large subunit [Bacteroidota bacterium]
MHNHITLYQLNNLIKETLDKNLSHSYWVVAEIGEIRMAQKGHCYLELVEKEDENLCAKIKANIWAYTYRNICGWFESITGKSLRPGMKILAQVAVSFHEVYGISLNVKDIDPNFTLGERSLKKQRVINQLKEEGV